MFDKITEAILRNVRHNPTEYIIGLVIALILIFLVGCEPTTESVRNPETRVTRAQLQNEIELYLVSVEGRFADLDQKEKFRNFVFKQAFIIAESGGINPLGILTTLGSLFGVGAFVDNRRKDSVIKKLKNSTE